LRKKGRRRKHHQAKPVAPFDKDIGKASCSAFDRQTGDMVPSKKLKTYREAIGQYHLSPESKFLNGDFTDRGRTERRHVQVTDVIHIGKEANKWKEGHVNAFTIAICSAMNAALQTPPKQQHRNYPQRHGNPNGCD
jgi:hypothetical protein